MKVEPLACESVCCKSEGIGWERMESFKLGWSLWEDPGEAGNRAPKFWCDLFESESCLSPAPPHISTTHPHSSGLPTHRVSASPPLSEGWETVMASPESCQARQVDSLQNPPHHPTLLLDLWPRLKSQQSCKDEIHSVTHVEVCYFPKELSEFCNLFRQGTCLDMAIKDWNNYDRNVSWIYWDGPTRQSLLRELRKVLVFWLVGRNTG
jgi:hypothetical protein